MTPHWKLASELVEAVNALPLAERANFARYALKRQLISLPPMLHHFYTGDVWNWPNATIRRALSQVKRMLKEKSK